MARTILKLAATQTGVDTGLTIPWPAALLDELGAYSGGQPTRLTIATTGYYVAQLFVAWTAGASSTDTVFCRIEKNGSTGWQGGAAQGGWTGSNFGFYGNFCQTGLVYLTAGDYLTAHSSFLGANAGTGNLLHNAEMPTLFVLRKVDNPKAVMTRMTTNQTGTLETAIPWEAETYDTDGAWVIGAPNVHTVPSGAVKASSTANLDHNASSISGVNILAEGINLARNYIQGSLGNVPECLYSGPMVVDAGDDITVTVSATDSTYVYASANTSFTTEFHNRNGCRLTLSADLTAINADTSPPYIIGWTAETFDDSAFHDPGANTRITVGAAGWVQLGGGVRLSLFGTLDVAQVRIQHFNSSDVLQASYRFQNVIDSAVCTVPVLTPDINASAGDYFRLGLEADGDTSCTIESESYFWIDVFPDEALGLGSAAGEIDFTGTAELTFPFFIEVSAAVSFTGAADLVSERYLSGETEISFSGSAVLETRTPVIGDAEVSFTGAALLDFGTLISAEAALNFDGSADLQLGTDLGAAAGTLNLTAIGNVILDPPFQASSAQISFAGSAALEIGTALVASGALIVTAAEVAGASQGNFFLIF